jgi:ABC-2 type transport system permease protein
MTARRLAHIYHLGVKELISLAHDAVVLVFLVYAFTVQIVVFSRGASVELRNATLAVVDEDRSPVSRRIQSAFHEPDFQSPVQLTADAVDGALDAGRYTFVVDIPARFEADLRARQRPTIQVVVDATAIGQALVGAAYIRHTIGDEVAGYLRRERGGTAPAVGLALRVKFNPNRESRWLMGVMELAMTITMLAIVLPAAALLREREHGTIGRLLVMPLTPAEIVLAKVWANTLVLFVSAVLCLWIVVAGILRVPLHGSLALFLVATLLFQLATAGIGVFLATFARTVPQLALLATVVMVPMMFLSGGWTPREAMPPLLQALMHLSPLTHYVDLIGAVIFRGAGLALVWPSLAAMSGIGGALLVMAIERFRATFTLARV